MSGEFMSCSKSYSQSARSVGSSICKHINSTILSVPYLKTNIDSMSIIDGRY